MRESGIPFLRSVMVSALLFGLFAEWLRPLLAMAELTEVHRLYPLLGAIGFYLALDATGVRGAFGWPLKLLFTIGWIGYWFRPDALADGTWWLTFPVEAAEDVRSALAGELLLRPETRTMLFLTGWSALVYAVHRITIERGHALWFVAATLSFLVLLQLWPGLDTSDGALRTAGIGMTLLALQHGAKWERLLGNRFSEARSTALARFGFCAACGAAALAIGYALSAGQPSESEPVSLSPVGEWLTSAAEGRFVPTGGAPAGTQTGFGDDDERLGRAVAPDDSVAFVAATSVPTYWRGDSKDVYTGRGWRSSALDDRSETFRNAAPPPGAEIVVQNVAALDDRIGGVVFAGGRVLRFLELKDPDGDRLSDIHVRADPDNDAYRIGTPGVRVGGYAIETALPRRDPDTLAADTAPPPRDPSDRYLQLPDELPPRVRELAERIVADVPDNRFLRARAIQSYLMANYRYSLNTEPPPPGADFVDTFLFETKEGYCNHFSTAMVVLLRAVGIEARWAKGFAPGEENADRPGTYVVRQSDAHSWVEVRFAESGWVPFEATPAAVGGAGTTATGFAGYAANAANMVLPASDGGAPAADPAATLAAANGTTPQDEPRSPFAAAANRLQASGERAVARISAAVSAGLASAAAKADAVEAAMRRLGAGSYPAWLPLAAWSAGGAALAAAALLAASRLRAALGRMPGTVALGPAGAARHSPQRRGLDRLWRRIYRRYGPRGRAETMREYAARLKLPNEAAREALIELVRYDEAVRYGGGGGQRVSRRRLEQLRRSIEA